MTNPIEPRTDRLYHRGSTLSPSHALAIVLAAFATYLVAAQLAPAALALPIAQAGFALALVVGVLVLRIPALPALGLRGARPRYFVAAIALGASAWYVNACLVALLPLPQEHARRLAAIVDAPPFAVALVMFALVPALIEELAFRGLLARALGRVQRLAAAAALSSLLFALYHLSIVQALPTFTLGVALAIIAVRADSVAPTILAHAINNAIVIALSRGALPGLDAWIAMHPLLALLVAAAASAGGLAIAARGGSRG